MSNGGGEYTSEMKRSEETIEYRDILINHLDVLTILYRDFMEEKANLNYNEGMFTKTIAEMIIILSQILPKLKGKGKPAEELYKKLAVFEPWVEEILRVKVKKEERRKVNDLYKLLLEAYTFLGLTEL